MTAMDVQRRKPFWRETKGLVLLCLIIPAVVIGSLAFWVERLGNQQLLGFPLGFLIAGNGVVLLSLAVVGWFAAKQDEIDRWHGAHEDDR